MLRQGETVTGRMHISRPAAMRTWAALMVHGGKATTAQIHGRTGSMAVHSDISSLRYVLCLDYGLPWDEREHYLKRISLPRRKADQQVILYVVRSDVRALWRRLEWARLHGEERQGQLSPLVT